MEPTSILLGEAISDANGACSDAKLFICSPHSCEVVKPVFFSRSFGYVNLKKELPQTGHLTCARHASLNVRKALRVSNAVAEHHDSSADRTKGVAGAMNSKLASFTGSVWAALCGRCGGTNTSALAMLRGPIRRRPYNRGEIVAKKRGQLILLNDFYW